MYDVNGACYEQDTYGAAHMRTYSQFRSDALGRLTRDAFPDREALTILEVGCGTGVTMEYLARLPFRHALYGVDFSRTMLNQAAARCASLANIPSFALASGFSLPFPDQTFDMVFATRFIHQFPHEGKKRIYAELTRVLRPGGIAAVEFYAFSYHWLRYQLRERSRKPKDAYFEHYPTRPMVREIAGSAYRTVPLRIAGARVIYSVFGQFLLQRMTSVLGRLSVLPLADEYLVVTRK
jgi:ubiquinone/menaquinone biosynthesis C-methylase UbiE